MTCELACVSQVIGALPERNGELFLDQLAPPIRKALCDDDAGVRGAGAQVRTVFPYYEGMLAFVPHASNH